MKGKFPLNLEKHLRPLNNSNNSDTSSSCLSGAEITVQSLVADVFSENDNIVKSKQYRKNKNQQGGVSTDSGDNKRRRVEETTVGTDRITVESSSVPSDLPTKTVPVGYKYCRVDGDEMIDYMPIINHVCEKASGRYNNDHAHGSDGAGRTGESSCITTSSSTSTILISCPLVTINHKDGVHACDPSMSTKQYQETGKAAVSIFHCLGFDEASDTSLVLCFPVTGRTHQLRLHLQLLGKCDYHRDDSTMYTICHMIHMLYFLVHWTQAIQLLMMLRMVGNYFTQNLAGKLIGQWKHITGTSLVLNTVVTWSIQRNWQYHISGHWWKDTHSIMLRRKICH